MNEEKLTEEDIIIALKQRAEEMLKNDYSRKIGDEEIYTIICEWEKTFDLYNKEKEKNKKYENKIKAVLELIDTKPYTAYTLYGDILYDDENIRELLEERS